jgi:hypothetical protein
MLDFAFQSQFPADILRLSFQGPAFFSCSKEIKLAFFSRYQALPVSSEFSCQEFQF